MATVQAPRSVSADPTPDAAPNPPLRRRPPGGRSRDDRARWWAELAILAVGYSVYAAIRNTRGDPSLGSVSRAVAHAQTIMHVESLLHLRIEVPIQNLFLHARVAVEGFDILYATAHVLVTAAVVAALWWLSPARYRRARTALLLTTAIALIGFAVFPTAPPRLLPPAMGARDTLGTIGGLWSFQTPAIERISDPLAAMPSLHLGWATWCTLAVWPACTSRIRRAAAISYPVLVSTVVIVTGNHWLLDVAAGVAIALGCWWVSSVHPTRRLRRSRPGNVVPMTPPMLQVEQVQRSAG